MNRKRVLEEIGQCTREELLAWRKHAQFCLEQYQREGDAFEVEECRFVIGHIDRRLAELAGGQW